MNSKRFKLQCPILHISVDEYNRRISTPLPGQIKCDCKGPECPLCKPTQLPPSREIHPQVDPDLISETPFTCKVDHDRLKPRLDQISRTFASELQNLTYDNGPMRTLSTTRMTGCNLGALPDVEAGETTKGTEGHQPFLDCEKDEESTSTRVPAANAGSQERKEEGETTSIVAPLIDLTEEEDDSLVTQDGSFLKRRFNSSLTTPEGECSELTESLKEAMYNFETFMCPSTFPSGGIDGPRLRPRLGRWRSLSSATASSLNETDGRVEEKSDKPVGQNKANNKKVQPKNLPTQKIIWIKAEEPRMMGRGRNKPRNNDIAKKVKPPAAHFRQWRGQTTVVHSARMNRAQVGHGQGVKEGALGEESTNLRKTPDVGATDRFLTSTQRRSVVAEPRELEFNASEVNRLSLPKPVPATDARKRKGSPLKVAAKDRMTSPMKRHATDNTMERGENSLLAATTLPVTERRGNLREVEDRLHDIRRKLNRRAPQNGPKILPHSDVQDASTTRDENTLNRRFIGEPSWRGSNRREATIDEEVVVLASNVGLLNRITRLETYATLLEGQVRRLTKRDVLSDERLSHAEHILPRIRKLEEQTAISGPDIRPPLCRACYVDMPAPEPYFECRRNPKHPHFDQRYGPVKPEPMADLNYPNFPKLGPI